MCRTRLGPCAGWIQLVPRSGGTGSVHACGGPGSVRPRGGLGRGGRERAYALGPSHAVDLTRLVADDVTDPAPVHTACGRPAAARPAAAGEAGIGVTGRRRDREHRGGRRPGVPGVQAPGKGEMRAGRDGRPRVPAVRPHHGRQRDQTSGNRYGRSRRARSRYGRTRRSRNLFGRTGYGRPRARRYAVGAVARTGYGGGEGRGGHRQVSPVRAAGPGGRLPRPGRRRRSSGRGR